jgi:beta-galactosidase
MERRFPDRWTPPAEVFRGAAGGPIEDGKIDGAAMSFRVGTTTYTGTVKGDEIELQRIAPPRRGGAGAPAAPAGTGPRPAVGPPLPGSDPSFGAGRGGQAPAPLVLHRVTR